MPLETNFFSSFRANRPEIKAVIKPINKGRSRIEEEKFKSFNWSRAAPKIAGRASKKEKLKTNSGRSLAKIPALIVLPEREMPGIIAIAWNKPIKSVFCQVRRVFLA